MIVEQAAAISSPLSAIPIFTLGGAVGRVDDDATAFTGRGAAHDINFVASWLPDDPSPSATRHGPGRPGRRCDRSAKASTSTSCPTNAQSHVKVAYGDQKYTRLAELKSKYDPTNVFRFNQNIPQPAERYPPPAPTATVEESDGDAGSEVRIGQEAAPTRRPGRV